jgi:hypothetical protein
MQIMAPWTTRGSGRVRIGRRMRRLPCAVAVFVLAGLPLARAQTGPAPVPGDLSATGTVQGSGGFGPETPAPEPRTLFTIDGSVVHVWAPVQAPYSNSAYQNFGGQQMQSGDSLLSPGAMGSGE